MSRISHLFSCKRGYVELEFYNFNDYKLALEEDEKYCATLTNPLEGSEHGGALPSRHPYWSYMFAKDRYVSIVKGADTILEKFNELKRLGKYNDLNCGLIAGNPELYNETYFISQRKLYLKKIHELEKRFGICIPIYEGFNGLNKLLLAYTLLFGKHLKSKHV